MSTVDFLGNAKDHSAASSDLARSGSPTFGYDGNSFIQCGVGTDFLQGSTSAQDVTGTEAWIDPALRGLTWGCWVNVGSSPTNLGGIASIWPNAPQYSYCLYWTSGNEVITAVSGSGTTFVLITSSAQALQNWTFVVGRFTPSTELALIVDQTKLVNTTSVPASLHNSTSQFEVGRLLANNARILQAKFRDVFICASVLSDETIENVRLSSLP